MYFHGPDRNRANIVKRGSMPPVSIPATNDGKRMPASLSCVDVRQGIDFSMIPVLSPWLAIYLPIPLGLLDGAWSLHCVCRGHFRHQDNASCVSRAGLCGTAWGCSGPSCALNFGLDLGLLITAVLAAFPAGASARGCGYDCYTLLCFPCAPVGGVGMAVSMILMTLGLAFGAAFKMWSMLSALTNGLSGQGFLPW